ncbi:hypothetical protein UCRPA7_6226 [Phaeoacremonium minimum UCRPA7]|uniref:Uncharacterized protein n=1 Tax=Phaeoacremonium minimum (strain UCR-PA7) TaxID=1286976 RepID=R8BG23_PHAM7|nr:hypothetical protein UCRPA7_6226 [Phaeoacremonium minimum UCRPA7]EON98245.1 hypothetical protein UCRPA7_6226 [Phaeoacremonium minimum UCRPA7]
MGSILNEEDGTDIGGLWNQALEDYARDSGSEKERGPDLRLLDPGKWTVSAIRTEQKYQLDVFSQYRHDKTKVDKLRALVSHNSDIIVGVAGHVANAASVAFPPASAILTAFTYVMSASKAVSDDYDMIESFFDIMNAFLERLQILESKLPDSKNFKAVLMRVFVSLLGICAIARKYRIKGRFVRWAKNLVDNGDPNLKSAYETLHKHLQRLEQATMMATLAQTIETSRDVRALGAGLDQRFEQTNFLVIETKGFARDAALTSQETLAAVRDMGNNSEALKEFLQSNFTTLNKRLREREGGGKGAPKDGLVDSGARKSTALNEVRQRLRNCHAVNWENSYKESRRSYAPGTFDWLPSEDGFTAIVEDKIRLLWITGEAGMGKSTLTGFIIETLRRELNYEPTSSIAHFYFKEATRWANNYTTVLCACAVQAAEQDTRYREDILTDMSRQRDWANQTYFNTNDNERLEEVLFFSKFSTETGARIQIIITTTPADVFTEAPTAEYRRLDLVKERIFRDIRIIVSYQIKNFSRLRKLTPKLRQRIALKLRQKSDNLRYIEHMLRRFNAIGREGPIWKELDNLPENTRSLYEQMLEECWKHRSDQERQALRKFFAWLAYSKEQLLLGMAKKLVSIIASEQTINVDEELDNKSSRLLRLSTWSEEEDAKSDTSENEHDSHDEVDDNKDDENADSVDDLSAWLGFQEPLLRAYFREKKVDHSGLRSSPSSGNAIILEVLARILCDEGAKDAKNSYLNLVTYAAQQWLNHLRDIDIDDLDDIEASSVITSIHAILSNKDNALANVENHGYYSLGSYSDNPGVFAYGDDALRQSDLEMLRKWATKAIRLSSGICPSTVTDWMRPFIQTPSRVFITLARGHINTWFFSADSQFRADLSFRYAHQALLSGKDLPELEQNRDLRDYFEEFEKDHHVFSAKSISIVANAFWDIAKTPQAYRSIGMALKYGDFTNEGLESLDKALQLAQDYQDDLSCFHTYVSIGEGKIFQAEHRSDDDAELQKTRLSESREAYEHAIALWPSLSEKDKATDDCKASICETYGYLSAVFVLEDKIDEALRVFREAQEQKISIWEEHLHRILEYLVKKEEWAKAVAFLKDLTREQRQEFLFWPRLEDRHDLIQRAGGGNGDDEYVLSLYSEFNDDRDLTISMWGSAWRLFEAEYRWRVLQKPEHCAQAKVLLNQVIENEQSTSAQRSEACFMLADILTEDFRNTADPTMKTKAYDEMKTLVAHVSEAMGNEFDATQSQTTVPLALMTKKLGPSIEFQRALEATFEGCYNGLVDTTGWNDSISLRTLAKVLSCLRGLGLDRDAEIAATCQLYVLDQEIHRQDLMNGDPGFEQQDDTDRPPTPPGEDGANNSSPTEDKEPEGHLRLKPILLPKNP